MSRPHAALIVDSDPKGLESLVYGFQGAGWRITACPAPTTASLLVKASGAQIVVIASRAGDDKMHTLLRQLRGRDAHRTLPVLLLGPKDLREPIKVHGDVDLLPFPAFVRDVLTAAQLLVGAGVAAAQRPGEEPRFEDSITALGTLSLVRTMNGLARSGSLHLVRKGRHGEILFHNGELTAAQIGQLQGMAAVQHLLVWADGSLELRLRPVARRGQLHQTAHEFVEEFDRFQRDYSHGMSAIGPASTVYTVNEESLQRSTGVVPGEVTPVVRLCDGQRPLCDVIDESPFRVLDTIRILSRLAELAILSRRDPPSEENHERTPLDEFWATARITSVAQEQPEEVGATPPLGPSAPEPPAQPAPEAAPASPFDVKPRRKRQTLEIGISPSPTPRSSGEQPGPAVPATGDLQATPSEDHTTPAPATPQPAVRKTPSPMLQNTPLPRVRNTPLQTSLSSLSRPSPAAGVPVVRPSQTANTQASGAFEAPKTGRQTQSATRANQPRRSVVIDTQLVNLVSEAPAAPAPVPTTAPATESGPSVKVAGELQVAPSKKSVRTVPAPARITVQLDASLTEEPPTPNLSAIPVAEAKKESSGARVNEKVKDAPSGKAARAASESGAHGLHRPSGSFYAVESDFFAREADIYEEHKTESFADLEEGKGKPGAKNRKPERK